MNTVENTVDYKFEVDATEKNDIQTIEYDVDTLYHPERLQNETYQEYVMRRKVANAKIKEILKGKVVWNSRKEGTYRKKVNAL